MSEDHLSGEIPSDDRIMEAHSAMLAEWLTKDPKPEHFVYKQGHDEQCYICVLWNAKRDAESKVNELQKVLAWIADNTTEAHIHRSAAHALQSTGGNPNGD